jgi:hypothetical protein
MVMRVSTVAFEGIEARAVDVQVQISAGAVAFIIARWIKPSENEGWLRGRRTNCS